MAERRDDLVEVRLMVPREHADVADAYGIAHRQNRTEVLTKVFREWAEHQIHVATVIQRVTRRNPKPSDADRNAGGN